MTPHRRLSIAMLTFISLGMPPAAFGVAWPSVAADLGRPLGDLGTAVAAYALGFFTLTTVAGRLVDRFGVGFLIVVAGWLATLCLGAYASANNWVVLLIAAFVLGMTGGTFDAALNAFAALELDARSMNLLHAGYGIGASIGPWMMTGAVALGAASGTAADSGSSGGWRAGMWIVATLAAAVAVILTLTRRAWALTPHEDDRATPLQAARGVVLAALSLFFVYTGVEIVAGQYAFTFLSEGRGVSVAAAGLAAGGFWFGLTVSRLALGLVGGRLSTRAVVTASSVTAAACLALLWWAPIPWVGLVGLVLAGLALGPIFPLNIALTPSRVGRRNAARMIGYQIAAANLGAASLPWLTGRAVDRSGLDVIGIILVTGAVALVIVDGVLRRLTPETQVTPQ